MYYVTELIGGMIGQVVIKSVEGGRHDSDQISPSLLEVHTSRLLEPLGFHHPKVHDEDTAAGDPDFLVVGSSAWFEPRELSQVESLSTLTLLAWGSFLIRLGSLIPPRGRRDEALLYPSAISVSFLDLILVPCSFPLLV